MTLDKPYNPIPSLVKKDTEPLSQQFERYLYKSKFKTKIVVDMLASGYIHAIAPFISNIESEILNTEEVARPVGTGALPVRRAVIRVTVTVQIPIELEGEDTMQSYRKISVSAIGSGASSEFNDPNVLERAVETRALKRAIARIVDISTEDFNQTAIAREEAGKSFPFDRKETERKPRSPSMADVADAADHELSVPPWGW